MYERAICVLAGAHEFVLDEILDQLDFQFAAVGGEVEGLLRDGAGHVGDARGRLGGQGVVLGKAEFGLEGAFERERDAGVVETAPERPSRLRTRNFSLSGAAAEGSRSSWVWDLVQGHRGILCGCGD